MRVDRKRSLHIPPPRIVPVTPSDEFPFHGAGDGTTERLHQPDNATPLLASNHGGRDAEWAVSPTRARPRRADGRDCTVDPALALPGTTGGLVERRQPRPRPGSASVTGPSRRCRVSSAAYPRIDIRPGPATGTDLPGRHHARGRHDHDADRRAARAAGRPAAARFGLPAARR